MVNKYLIYGAAVAVGAVGATQILKYNSLRKELEIQVMPVQHKASSQGVEIRLEVLAKNPTCNSFSIKYTQITLIHNGVAFMSSTASEKTFSFEKRGQVQFSPITFRISYLTLATLAPSLLSEIRKEGKLNIMALIQIKLEGFISLNREVAIVSARTETSF